MNEELKTRIINALTDYADTLDSLANIYSAYGDERSLVDTVNMIDNLIVDVRKVDDEKTKINPTSIGQRAVITNSGVSYTTYENFFIENAIDEKYAKRYDYDVTPSEEDAYIVVGDGYHCYYDRIKIYVLQNIATHRVYLVEEKGIEFID